LLGCKWVPARLTRVVKYDYDEAVVIKNEQLAKQKREISWIKAARKDFESFPIEAQLICRAALAVASDGGKSEIAKPLVGLGFGVFEIAHPYRGNAFRVVYAVQLADAIWVVHAFQKKSTHGIRTPQHEIELVKSRLKQVKEMLR